MHAQTRRALRDLAIVIATTAILTMVGVVVGTKYVLAAPADWCDQPSDVVILGDSTSTGYGTTGYTGGNESPYQPTRYGWTSRLMTSVADEHGITVWNLARNGALVSDFLPADVGLNNPRQTGPLNPNAVDEIADVDAGLVIIILGANEYGYGVGQQPTVYEANLAELLDRIDAAVAADVLLVHSWEFSYRWPGNSSSWTDYGNVMETVASQHGADYLDQTEYLEAAQDDDAGIYHADEYGPDGAVHMTDAGNVAMSALMQRELRCAP